MNRPFNVTRESYRLDIDQEGFFSKMMRKLDDKIFFGKNTHGDEIFTFDITVDKEEEYDVDEFAHRTPFFNAFGTLLSRHSLGDPAVALNYQGPATNKDIQKVIDGSKETIDKFKEWKKDLGKQRRKPYTVDSSYLHIQVGLERGLLKDYGTRVDNEVTDKTIGEFFKAIDNYERAYNDFCKSLTKFIIKREKK